MSAFWSGYLAGLISVFLPSLIMLAVVIHRAPDWSEAMEALDG